MATASMLRTQLVDRRDRLSAALVGFNRNPELTRLLGEVDAALERMEAGTYGLCESCHDSIEADRLLADPTIRLCLDHLTPAEQHALEEDLLLASRIQIGLLPRADQAFDGWHAAYLYEAAGPVSGDYCDLIPGTDGALLFALGDVSGKGVAASMLMSNLHALFRTLASLDLPLTTIVERASRAFCESTLPMHFATLVCGRADRAGAVELCNAGHLPALLVATGGVTRLEATNPPVGIFCHERFASRTAPLQPEDALVLYSDGFPETFDPSGAEYGIERLADAAHRHRKLPPEALIRELTSDVDAFSAGAQLRDDRTMLVLRREPR